MKNNMVKKLLTLALAGAMTLSLAACGSKSDDSSNDAQQGGDESGKTYKVAIIKQLDHASLDEIANAVATELDKIAADNGVTIEYDITSGQNDQTILKQLSDQAIADQVDAIIPIATTAAQISALSAEDTLLEEETRREQEEAHELMLQRLREALATLTPTQARRLHARFVEGKKYREIAEDEGIASVSLVTNTVRDAILKLRKYFIKRGWMEPLKEDAICTKKLPPKRNRKKTSAKKS